MSVLDDILGKDPERQSVEFCVDQSLRRSLAEAQGELKQAEFDARRNSSADKDGTARKEIESLRARVADLVEQAKARLVRFSFDALDANEFEALKEEHPPTREQKADAQREGASAPEWNTDTFPPAVVAAACVKVETPSGEAEGLSLEEAQKIWESRAYNSSERAELFHTALAPTLTRTQIDLPRGV